MWEVSDKPPISLLDESYEYPVEEEAHYEDTGAIVSAAFHDRVHFYFLFFSTSVFCDEVY